MWDHWRREEVINHKQSEALWSGNFEAVNQTVGAPPLEASLGTTTKCLSVIRFSGWYEPHPVDSMKTISLVYWNLYFISEDSSLITYHKVTSEDRGWISNIASLWRWWTGQRPVRTAAQQLPNAVISAVTWVLTWHNFSSSVFCPRRSVTAHQATPEK